MRITQNKTGPTQQTQTSFCFDNKGFLSKIKQETEKENSSNQKEDGHL